MTRVHAGAGGHAAVSHSLPLAARIVIVWRWMPLGAYADPSTLAAVATYVRQSPYEVPMVVGAFVVAGPVFMPVTALVDGHGHDV